MQKLSILTLLAVFAASAVILVQYPQGLLQGADDRTSQTAPGAAAAASEGDAPASSTTVPGESADAVDLIHQAKQRLFGYTSVKATLREFVALGDRRFEAEGSYVAGPFNPLPQLRLEYHVRAGNTVATLLEVCDGQILRTQRTIQRLDGASAGTGKAGTVGEPEISVTRRDVRKILAAVQKEGTTPEAIVQAELGIGGLPALLTSLERAMVFDSVRQEPLGGRECHVVQGRWRPEFLETLQSQFAKYGRNVETFLPEFVRIHLDAESLFPVRISYWPKQTDDGRKLPPLLTLEFTDIHLNEPVNPLLFEYVRPQGVDEAEVTDQFLEAIRATSRDKQEGKTPPPTP